MAAALHVVRFVVLFVLRSVMRFVVRVEFDVVQLSCTEGDGFASPGCRLCTWINSRGGAEIELGVITTAR
jgi:hypothetical protein